MASTVDLVVICPVRGESLVRGVTTGLCGRGPNKAIPRQVAHRRPLSRLHVQGLAIMPPCRDRLRQHMRHIGA